MGYLEDLIKSKLVQLGDTTLKTVAPIVRHARMRAKVTKEAEEGTNRLWQLRTLPKVIQQDKRTTTQKVKDRKEADEKHLQYQLQLNELKAAEGFDNLLKLTSPSTYVEAATGLQLTPTGRLATDILAFGIVGGAKSLLTRGGSKAISSPSIIRTSSTQRTLGKVKGISGEIPTTPAEWTAAQDAAIARGDMAEARRLRDLHFKVSAPNTTVVNELGDPVHNYHGTTNSFTAFDPQKIGSTTGDKSGFFFSDNKLAADFYSHETGSFWNNLKLMFGLYKGHKPQIYNVYLNTAKPMITDFHGGVDKIGREVLAKEAIENGNDANILQNIIDGPPNLPHNVTIMRNPNKIKSAEAVTYDNNGVRIPLGERDNFDINDIRWFSTHPITRASKVHLTRNNPLQTRLARLREHTRYGFTPETNLGLMITPRIRSHYVKAFAKQIDPNLTEELLNLIVQIAYANGRGMHIPIGNNAGETIGGLSIVDIQNAVKYLKQSGIKDVTPNDIGIIAGHEAGHGVLISPAAKRAIEGFPEPDEFYTRAGQVLDAAGIKSTANKRILFNQFMNMIDDYLSKGNLDNGVSEIRDFLRSRTKAVNRLNIMKHINELSGFSGAAYLGSKYYEKKIH